MKDTYNFEGMQIEVERPDENDGDAEKRKMAYCFKMIRAKSGMSRKEFSDWLGVPYRTMQEWEIGRRTAGNTAGIRGRVFGLDYGK